MKNMKQWLGAFMALQSFEAAQLSSAIAAPASAGSAPIAMKHLGNFGPTWPLVERNFLDVMMERLTKAKSSGALEALNATFKKRVERAILTPKPVAGITTTKRSRSFLFDPSITFPADILDERGAVVVRAGTKANPLDHFSWGDPMIFIDGTDADQVRWVQRYAKRYASQKNARPSSHKIVLVAGSPKALEIKLHRPVYFDQMGRLTQRFGITQVPCVVTQRSTKLLVEEVHTTT